MLTKTCGVLTQAQRRPPGAGRAPRSRAGRERKRPEGDAARRKEADRLEQRLKRLADEQEALPTLAAALGEGTAPLARLPA